MSAIRHISVSVVSGFLFGILEGVINANPLAQRLFAVYKPIAKASVSASAGMLIDLAYGFIMAGSFLLLYKSPPGRTGIVKGMSVALLAWFFLVVMDTAFQWRMMCPEKRCSTPWQQDSLR